MIITNQPPFYGHYTGQRALASTSKTGGFSWSKFYFPYALADGSQCIRIREKTLEFSWTVLSTLSVYLQHIDYKLIMYSGIYYTVFVDKVLKLLACIYMISDGSQVVYWHSMWSRVCASVGHPSVCPSIYPSVCLSVCLSQHGPQQHILTVLHTSKFACFSMECCSAVWGFIWCHEATVCTMLWCKCVHTVF